MSLRCKLTNQTNGIKLITKKLSYLPLFKPFRDKMIENLLMYHPEIDVGVIVNLFVRYSEYHKRQLWYENKTGHKSNISYRKCVRNFFGNYDQRKEDIAKMKSECRKKIYNDKHKTFRRENDNGICSHCKTKCNNLQVDHDGHNGLSFKQIYCNFIGNENENIVMTNEMLDDFEKYHDKNVKYRMLCRRCNLTFGDYSKKTLVINF